MRKTMIQFTDSQYAELYELAHEQRRSISELVREIVEKQYGLEHEEVQKGIAYTSPGYVKQLEQELATREKIDRTDEAERRAEILERTRKSFTPRELRMLTILTCTTLPPTTKAIAEEMGLTMNTAAQLRQRVYGKLHVFHRDDLVAEAHRIGLIEEIPS